MKTLKEILQLPLLNRCHELAKYFDLASIKDLHDGFPTLIKSIFYSDDAAGWRFRLITAELTPVEYDTLTNFFDPVNGPLFRMLYRLTGESLTYFVPLCDVPVKLQTMLISGQFPAFYKDKVCIDPYQNAIAGLQMSPFHYFLFYFALNGAQPVYPNTGPSTAKDRMTSVYIALCCVYTYTFLRTNAQFVELPQNVDSPDNTPVKSPLKAIKYLLPHLLELDMSLEQPELARIVLWRATSIVHIFIDVWFGMDMRPPTMLPTLECIRCMRVLIKQVHAFGNCTDRRDSDAFIELRKTSREKLRACFTDTFVNMFYRWPLYDGTLIDVVELWLSYIQPWRYQDLDSEQSVAPTLERTFLPFIALNLAIYTQTFLTLIWRVKDIDLTTLLNANVLYRPCRVFAQQNLLLFLRECEAQKLNSMQSMLRPADAVKQYQPLFSDESSLVLKKFLRKLRATIAMTKKNVEHIEANRYPRLLEMLHNEIFNDDNRELKEVLPRLIFAEKMLVASFDLPATDEDPLSIELPPDNAETGVKREETILSSEYWSDPALQPVRAGEIAFLVRFLHTVSSKLQLMYGARIKALWNNQHVLCMLFRQLLMPPRTVHRFVRQGNGSKQLMTEQLPARICLRPLASYKVLALILCSLLLAGALFGAPSYGILALICLTMSGNVVHALFFAPTLRV